MAARKRIFHHNHRRRRRRLNRLGICLGIVIFLGGVAIVYFQFLYFGLTTISYGSSQAKQQPSQTNQHVRIGKKQQQQQMLKFVPNPKVNYNVHVFYYPWYCNVETDSQYMHWNHPILPHWDPKVSQRYPNIGQQYDPTKDDLGASFFPQLGAYSSADPKVIRQHFEWFVQAGIGVAVVSWLPLHKHDDNGPPIAHRLPQLLDLALDYGIQIAIHMEPYDQRTPESFEQDVLQLIQQHGSHPSMYKQSRPGGDITNLLPVLYVYDQYRVPASEWKRLLQNGNFPAITLALIVEKRHWQEYVMEAGFDGGYTYFASKTFTYGSNPSHWKAFQTLATKSGNKNNNKFFIPSVGPGYDDTRIRPWNSVNTHDRAIVDGTKSHSYYSDEWKAAVESGADIISITSFNEWHEGTQIEPAISKRNVQGSYNYKNYGGKGPNTYLDLTRKHVDEFTAAAAQH